jgi:putative PIN family toxin of toxin-antitoxin system
LRVILDTNVLVSGLISAHGPPGRILDGILLGDLVPVVDDRVLAEYADVLARPRFRFDPAHRDGLLLYMAEIAERALAATLPAQVPDPDDLAFLEVAHASFGGTLITGNLRHFPEEARGVVRVRSPGDFVAEWREGRRPAGSTRR